MSGCTDRPGAPAAGLSQGPGMPYDRWLVEVLTARSGARLDTELCLDVSEDPVEHV
jgi:hypothetical protein